MKNYHEVPPQSSSNEAPKANGSRRSALKRLGAGGVAAGAAAALPGAWTRPVVESVMLPAHAQTSGVPDGEFGLEVSFEDTRWIDWLVPKAYAVTGCNAVSGCAILRNGIVTLSVNFADGGVGCYSGAAPIGNSFDLALTETEDELVCTNVEATPGVSILGIQGEAPNRTIEIDMLGDPWTLTEGYNNDCGCGNLPA
ncbi:MAG: twin-arginine translocation signal domain-containing protein [Gammaproteobacteria bacterium]|nr:twin-arginine translocation signal domain-containing protein [Gammaproteobacteria bacterium]